jgi:hypothetical protein
MEVSLCVHVLSLGTERVDGHFFPAIHGVKTGGVSML